MPDIKLIPREYKEYGGKESIIPASDTLGFLLSILSKIWLFICLTALIISTAAYGYLYYSKNKSEKDLQTIKENIKKLSFQRDKNMEAKIVDLGKNAEELDFFLDKHVYPSKIFSLLEELVLNQVQILNIQIDLGKYNLALNCQAASYETLAQQMVSFRENPGIKKMEVSGITLTQAGDVNFTLLLDFDDKLIKEQK